MALLNIQFDLIKNLKTNAEFKGKALSSSMSPLIYPGDTLTIKKVPFFRLKKGDIIAFVYFNTEKIRVHRVIKTFADKNKVITKGDNLGFSDQLVGKKEYIGKVIYLQNNYCKISLSDWRSKIFAKKFVNKTDFFVKKQLRRILFCTFFFKFLWKVKSLRKS